METTTLAPQGHAPSPDKRGSKAVPAVIYARYSPRPDKEVESIATQMDRCRKYCEAKDYEVLASFSDEDVSGKSREKRPGLAAAMRAACKARAVLVSYSMGRVARNTRDALDILDELHESQANLAVLDQDINTSTPIGTLFFTLSAALQQLEREQISQRTRDAMERLQADGKLMGRIPPYGWRIDPADPKRLAKVEAEQAAILRILELYDEGLGLRPIAKRLDAEGAPRRGIVWRHTTVENIVVREGRRRKRKARVGCCGKGSRKRQMKP